MSDLSIIIGFGATVGAALFVVNFVYSFKLIDAGYKILSETMHTITWDGEVPPRSFGVELVAA